MGLIISQFHYPILTFKQLEPMENELNKLKNELRKLGSELKVEYLKSIKSEIHLKSTISEHFFKKTFNLRHKSSIKQIKNEALIQILEKYSTDYYILKN